MPDPDPQFGDTEDLDLNEGELQTPYDGEVVIVKADRSLKELKDWFDEGSLICNPEWQRNYVWTPKQASLLIESFLLSIPVPVIYLAKTQDEKYEVLDGLQRLTSVFRFLNNKLKLAGLGIRDGLNGKFYKDLDQRNQGTIRKAVLQSFELHKNTDPNMRFVVFERLNTGGTKLNEMEIRNCLYRGALNDAIKQLAKDENFLKSVNMPHFSRRMKDRAFVLRFLAFYESTYLKCRNGLKKFLNDFLELHRNPSNRRLREFSDVFRRCSKASLTVFGEHGFRLKKADPRSSTSAGPWSPTCNASIFQCVATSFADYSIETITKNADRIYEEYLDLIGNDHRWVDCVSKRTTDTSRVTYVFETWRNRLQALVSTHDTERNERAFSQGLKRQMFDSNANCTMCKNEIKMIDDAVLDHEEHYWRGGKTIPENARLAHRFCNASRGGR